MVTPKGNMSTERETLQISVLPEQVLDMSILGDAADVNPATHFARVWQELDYRIDIAESAKCGHIVHL